MSLVPGKRVFDFVTILFCTLSIASAIWPASADVSLLTRIGVIVFVSVLLCLPYAILWFVGVRLAKPILRWAALAVMTLLFAFWAWVFLTTFIYPSGPNPQAGLVFFAVPAYMIIAALLAGFLLRMMDSWKKTGDGSA